MAMLAHKCRPCAAITARQSHGQVRRSGCALSPITKPRRSIVMTQVRATRTEDHDTTKPTATRVAAGVAAALVLAIGGTAAVVQPATAESVPTYQVATVPSDALLEDYAKKCAGVDCDPFAGPTTPEDLPGKALAAAEKESKEFGSPGSPTNAVPDVGGAASDAVSKIKKAIDKNAVPDVGGAASKVGGAASDAVSNIKEAIDTSEVTSDWKTLWGLLKR